MRNLRVILTGLCGVGLAASFIPHLEWLAYLAAAFGSYFAIRSTYESLSERSVDVDFLMLVAAVGAILVGQPRDGAALLFLFSLSSTLEQLAMARTRSAIAGLVKLRPSSALRLVGDGEERVPLEALRLGDRIRIPAFEPIPVDGEILEGRSSVDTSAMTGESIPVSVQPGERLLGGTQNLDGMLTMRVDSTIGDSTLDKIVALVEDAQENKASGERISTWFGQRYTFFVLAAFGISLPVRFLLGATFPIALYQSLTLLVALSPCALVISTPATTLSALAWAARNGVLVRGGEFIERAGLAKVVALDKTGTLTRGRPELREICVCAGRPAPSAVRGGAVGCGDDTGCWAQGESISPASRRLLELAAAAEQYVSHPVARAVLEAAERFHVPVVPVDEYQSVPGLGVSAVVAGVRVRMGQERFLIESGVQMPEEFREHLRELQDMGMTVAVLASDDGLAAFGFGDVIRPEAPALIRELKAAGIEKVVMLTGDTVNTAAVVGRELQIDEVYAALLPQEKTELVERLTEGGRGLIMVGDGINDAPSLARADVGVAMGGLGSDIALNAADVVLMRDRLDAIPDLIQLGRQTNATVRTNLIFASAVIIALTTASLVTTLPLPIAVIGHEGSTVLVILNGLRLLRGPRRAHSKVSTSDGREAITGASLL